MLARRLRAYPPVLRPKALPPAIVKRAAISDEEDAALTWAVGLFALTLGTVGVYIFKTTQRDLERERERYSHLRLWKDVYEGLDEE